MSFDDITLDVHVWTYPSLGIVVTVTDPAIGTGPIVQTYRP
jgi:hypothetical protein